MLDNKEHSCVAHAFHGCPGKPLCERPCIQVPRTAEPTVTGRTRTLLGYAVAFIAVFLIAFTGLSLAAWERQQTVQERV